MGKGSYGAVYACKDSYLGNSMVALKIFHPKALRYANSAKRLAQEIQAANRIDHENIVRFYDFFRYDNLCVITMEFVNGQSLRNYIESHTVPNYNEIAEIARQITLGLQIIHDNDIIHRDMKPDNIILTEDNHVKITDFGIASIVEGGSDGLREEYVINPADPTKKKRRLIGTMRYISPESVKFGQYDKRSDLYALGVILYELVVGKYFFTYKDHHELLKLKVVEDPLAPKDNRPDCPLMLNKICLKLLQRDPKARYQSTSELMSDIAILKSELAGVDVRFEATLPDNIKARKENPKVNKIKWIIIIALFIFIISLILLGFAF